MIVRDYRLKDIVKVWALYSRLHFPKDIFSLLIKVIVCVLPGAFKGIFNPLFFDVLVCELDKKIVGFGYLKGDYDKEESSFAIAVDSMYENIGIGTLLTKGILDTARIRGYKIVRLSVSPTNLPAVKIYENLGFKTVKISMGFRIDG